MGLEEIRKLKEQAGQPKEKKIYRIPQVSKKRAEKIAAENNSITNGFVNLGIDNKNAFDSQALIELKNEYCTKKKCLSCSIGNSLLKN